MKAEINSDVAEGCHAGLAFDTKRLAGAAFRP